MTGASTPPGLPARAPGLQADENEERGRAASHRTPASDLRPRKHRAAPVSEEEDHITPSRLACLSQLQEELCCAICLDLCCRPCTAPCGHTFCRKCLRTSLQFSPLCAKCRAPIAGSTLAINHAMWATIQLLFPKSAAVANPPTPRATLGLQPAGSVARLEAVRQRRRAVLPQAAGVQGGLFPSLNNPFRPPWRQPVQQDSNQAPAAPSLHHSAQLQLAPAAHSQGARLQGALQAVGAAPVHRWAAPLANAHPTDGQPAPTGFGQQGLVRDVIGYSSRSPGSTNGVGFQGAANTFGGQHTHHGGLPLRTNWALRQQSTEDTSQAAVLVPRWHAAAGTQPIPLSTHTGGNISTGTTEHLASATIHPATTTARASTTSTHPASFTGHPAATSGQPVSSRFLRRGAGASVLSNPFRRPRPVQPEDQAPARGEITDPAPAIGRTTGTLVSAQRASDRLLAMWSEARVGASRVPATAASQHADSPPLLSRSIAGGRYPAASRPPQNTEPTTAHELLPEMPAAAEHNMSPSPLAPLMPHVRDSLPRADPRAPQSTGFTTAHNMRPEMPDASETLQDSESEVEADEEPSPPALIARLLAQLDVADLSSLPDDDQDVHRPQHPAATLALRHHMSGPVDWGLDSDGNSSGGGRGGGWLGGGDEDSESGFEDPEDREHLADGSAGHSPVPLLLSRAMGPPVFSAPAPRVTYPGSLATHREPEPLPSSISASDLPRPLSQSTTLAPTGHFERAHWQRHVSNGSADVTAAHRPPIVVIPEAYQRPAHMSDTHPTDQSSPGGRPELARVVVWGGVGGVRRSNRVPPGRRPRAVTVDDTASPRRQDQLQGSDIAPGVREPTIPRRHTHHSDQLQPPGFLPALIAFGQQSAGVQDVPVVSARAQCSYESAGVRGTRGTGPGSTTATGRLEVPASRMSMPSATDEACQQPHAGPLALRESPLSPWESESDLEIVEERGAPGRPIVLSGSESDC